MRKNKSARVGGNLNYAPVKRLAPNHVRYAGHHTISLKDGKKHLLTIDDQFIAEQGEILQVFVFKNSFKLFNLNTKEYSPIYLYENGKLELIPKEQAKLVGFAHIVKATGLDKFL